MRNCSFCLGEYRSIQRQKWRPGIKAEGYEPLLDLLDGFPDNGGKTWICPAGVKAKGMSADELIKGVKIAGATKTMALLKLGARLLA